MARTNTQGQTIGRKGTQSRLRLMKAARELLAADTPHKLTASSIARAAKLASQTFYLYFRDIDDLLLALAKEAAVDLKAVHAALGGANERQSPFELSRQFIEAYSEYWEHHRAVLTVRNYLADAGNHAFIKARAEDALPIINLIADRIMVVHSTGDLDRKSAFARSVVIFSAIERMAARPATMQHEPTLLSGEDLKRAEMEILTLLFTPEFVAAPDSDPKTLATITRFM